MTPSSEVASSPISVESGNPSNLLRTLAEFLIRRRILLSLLLFIVLIGEDVAFGSKPHDVLDFRDPVGVLGTILVLSGLALRSWSVGILRKNRELTTTGPYRLIRNPLYVGSFMMMFGFCAIIGDSENIWFVVGPVLLMYIVKVRQEERSLSALFPQQWPDYARQTPRFFPRIGRLDLKADWSGAQWMRSREYQAVAATAVALVALKIWQASPF